MDKMVASLFLLRTPFPEAKLCCYVFLRMQFFYPFIFYNNLLSSSDKKKTERKSQK